jgi:ornithine carbamoyltransferase
MKAAEPVVVKQPLFLARSQRMAPPDDPTILSGILDDSSLRGRDLLSIDDFSEAELLRVLDVAKRLKIAKYDVTQTLFAKGQTLAMLFEKPSLRTRVTFEAGMTQLGGSAIYLEGQLGVRESVADVARNLDRWLDGIMARVFRHSTLTELSENAQIPIVNGLSDLEHPCQALADIQTLHEKKGKLQGLKIAYIGDGNNVAHSLMLLAAKLGIDFTIACPGNFAPDENIWKKALSIATRSGAKVEMTEKPKDALSNADAVYTDVWTSMGQEDESEKRAKIFARYQLNSSLLKHAKPDAIVMHCLPAHREQEITSEVLDGPQSVVFDQAENRLHLQKAVLSLIL